MRLTVNEFSRIDQDLKAHCPVLYDVAPCILMDYGVVLADATLGSLYTCGGEVDDSISEELLDSFIDGQIEMLQSSMSGAAFELFEKQLSAQFFASHLCSCLCALGHAISRDLRYLSSPKQYGSLFEEQLWVSTVDQRRYQYPDQFSLLLIPTPWCCR